MTERRRLPRLTPAAYGIVRTRLRPGQPAELIDLSSDGACLDTSRRLLPGTAIDLYLERTADTLAIKARVIRCAIVTVAADRLGYRAGVSFNVALPWCPTSTGNHFTELASREFPTSGAFDTRATVSVSRVHEDTDEFAQ